MSSTDKFLGSSLRSEILYLEQLIDLGISLIIVFAFTRLFSKAKAIVKGFKN